VDESLQIETNQTSLDFFLTNQIHETGNLKAGVQTASTNQIFKGWTCESGFASLQIQICEDLCHLLPRIF
jgi:hypothetical protein